MIGMFYCSSISSLYNNVSFINHRPPAWIRYWFASSCNFTKVGFSCTKRGQLAHYKYIVTFYHLGSSHSFSNFIMSIDLKLFLILGVWVLGVLWWHALWYPFSYYDTFHGSSYSKLCVLNFLSSELPFQWDICFFFFCDRWQIWWMQLEISL